LASVGTRSALALRTVASDRPFNSERGHRDPVVVTDRHDQRVTHGDPGDMVDETLCSFSVNE
jgi:hypothetical protein